MAGTAAFVQDAKPCHLAYEVICDATWATRHGKVSGWLGHDLVELDIRVSPDKVWALNGHEAQSANGCTDLDLGFTPATNLIALRRLALDIGQEARAEATSAYLEFPQLVLGRSEQVYRRVSAERYDYASPAYDYAETLEVLENGFITAYPHLWIAE